MSQLKITAIDEVKPVPAERVADVHGTVPTWRGMLHALVGEGESGKTWLAAHTALATARAGLPVLILDGEMSAQSWRRRLDILGMDTYEDNGNIIFYAEMTNDSVDTNTIVETVTKINYAETSPETPLGLIIWDSALSLLSRTAKSENDNAEVSRVYDRIREIVRLTNAAGLIVDHTTRGSSQLVSRGATAKFNALDVSYGIKLAEGSVPSVTEPWSSIVSVEKDRHGLLGNRADREATFIPLGAGHLQLDIVPLDSSSHRLSTGNPQNRLLAKIEALEPAPTSANDAHRRLGGRKQDVLKAYREWSTDSGSRGSHLKVGNRGTAPVPAVPGTGSQYGTVQKCSVCDAELLAPTSRNRGLCEKCARVAIAEAS